MLLKLPTIYALQYVKMDLFDFQKFVMKGLTRPDAVPMIV